MNEYLYIYTTKEAKRKKTTIVNTTHKMTGNTMKLYIHYEHKMTDKQLRYSYVIVKKKVIDELITN
jgi:hypothetical protein